MGQTTSHNKHGIRNEFLKTNLNQQISTNSNQYSNFPIEDLNEDEDLACPTLNSRNSYVIILFY